MSEISIPDTGRTRTDLLALMRGAVDVYRGSLEAAVMPSLVEAMSRDAELARLVRRSSSHSGARRFRKYSSAGSSAATCDATSTSTSHWTCSVDRSSTAC